MPTPPTRAHVSADVDVSLLRAQRDWLLKLPCRISDLEPREGLVNLLDHLLDVAEGHAPAR
jgi:hypothetical protein